MHTSSVIFHFVRYNNCDVLQGQSVSDRPYHRVIRTHIPPTCLNPRTRISVVEGFRQAEVLSISIDPVICDVHVISAVDANRCLVRVFVIRVDIVLSTCSVVFQPALSIGGAGAVGPSYHLRIVAAKVGSRASELAAWRLKYWASLIPSLGRNEQRTLLLGARIFER